MPQVNEFSWFLSSEKIFMVIFLVNIFLFYLIPSFSLPFNSKIKLFHQFF